MNKIIFTIIGWLSIIATPVAPAYFFGAAVASTIETAWLGNIVGTFAAIGLEGIGIFAGHTAVKSFRLGLTKEGLVATAVLIAYVVLGAYKLEGFGRIMFFMAPLGYLILGLHDSIIVFEEQSIASENEAQRAIEAQLAADNEAKLEAIRLEAERQKERDQLAAQRQERIDQQAAEKERLAHEERMAKIAAKTAATSRQDSDNLPHEKRQEASEKVSWRTMSPEERLTIAHATPAQLAEKYPHVAERTIRKWRQDSAQLAATVPPNSPYVAEQGASGD